MILNILSFIFAWFITGLLVLLAFSWVIVISKELLVAVIVLHTLRTINIIKHENKY